MLIITNITIMQGLLKHNVEVEWRRKWGRACRFFTVIVAMHPGFNMFPSFDSFLASTTEGAQSRPHSYIYQPTSPSPR